MSRAQPAADRFWAKVQQVGECWVWQGAKKTGTGYGYFHAVSGTTVRAHRWAYEQMVGPIPDGLQLDHLCRNPSCVNPSHLDPVTAKVNTARSESFAALNARKTHCPQGHPYDADNTRIDKRGLRHCRECRNAQCRAYYLRRKAIA